MAVVLARGCASLSEHRACGVLYFSGMVGRLVLSTPNRVFRVPGPLSFVSSAALQCRDSVSTSSSEGVSRGWQLLPGLTAGLGTSVFP